ncbi:MAG: hypothetical protein WBQ32_02610, partial [Ignavibacteriaceae bacterium]
EDNRTVILQVSPKVQNHYYKIAKIWCDKKATVREWQIKSPGSGNCRTGQIMRASQRLAPA